MKKLNLIVATALLFFVSGSTNAANDWNSTRSNKTSKTSAVGVGVGVQPAGVMEGTGGRTGGKVEFALVHKAEDAGNDNVDADKDRPTFIRCEDGSAVIPPATCPPVLDKIELSKEAKDELFDDIVMGKKENTDKGNPEEEAEQKKENDELFDDIVLDDGNIHKTESDYDGLKVKFDDMSDKNTLGEEKGSIICKYGDASNSQEECPPKVNPKDCPDCLYEPKPAESIKTENINEDDQAQKRMAAERRASARNVMDGDIEPNMGLREGSEDPIPGIDVIILKDPSAIPVHFDGSACLDCGEESVRLSDKTSEILVKAMPKIQNQGWKLALKEVDIKKYPKGTQAPAIPAKKVEKKKLFGLFGVEVEIQAEINPEGEIQNVDKPWWSFLAW